MKIIYVCAAKAHGVSIVKNVTLKSVHYVNPRSL